MIAHVRKHKHAYKIIGTSHVWAGKIDGFIMCDLVCDRCGRTKTVYVYDDYESQIMQLASKGEYFNIPNDCVLEEKEYEKYSKLCQRQETAEIEKYGHWIDHGYEIECSVCGFTCNDPHYLGNGVACPNCGHPMKDVTSA